MNDKPTLTVIDCKAAPEIRTVVLDVHDYHVRERYNLGVNAADTIRLQGIVKRTASQKLLRWLEKYIHFDVDMVDQHITAKIWMPYIKDDVVKKAREDSRFWMQQSDKWHAMFGNERLRFNKLGQAVAAFNALPWYKRIFRKIEL